MGLPRSESPGSFVETEIRRLSLVRNGGDRVADVKCEAEIGEKQILGPVAVKIEATGDEAEACDVGSLVNRASSALDIGIGDNGGRGDSDSDGQSSSSDSSSLSSSSSDSSSSDDEEEEEEKNEVEIAQGLMEEGEIRDGDDGDNVVGHSEDGDGDEEEDAETETEAEVEKMVEWSDADDEDDGGVGVEKGPIRSKNELQVLPLVPPVNAVLLPHHQPQPVGLISSVLGTQVIVEGIEKHNPLNEGSILWLTEKQSPLGLIDEIFGPVKNPFYVVRFNSESEAPEGISEGALVSFVPEFAGFVLSDQNLYKKGYDASGENDEELSDEVEFSDDEKEAEYRRMQKMAKRVINGQTVGNNKKRNKKKVDERQREGWKNNNNKLSAQQTRVDTNQKPQNGNQHNGPPTPGSNNINDFVPTSPPMLQQLNPGHFPGNWPNGVFPQHQHNPPAAMFGGFAPPLGNIQNTLQMVMQHILPFQQQFNPGQGSLPGNVMLPGPPPNFFPSSGFMPWSAAAPGVGVVNQGCFNQSSFGMGFLPQPTNPTMNMGDQRMMAVNGNMQSSTNISGNTGQSLRQNFNFGGMGFVPQPTNPVMNMGYQATTAINSNVQSSTNISGSNVQSPQQSGNILHGQPPHNFSMDSDPGRKPVHRRGRGRFGGRGR